MNEINSFPDMRAKLRERLAAFSEEYPAADATAAELRDADSGLVRAGTINEQQLTETIEAVSQPQRKGFLGTAWTMVMDLTHPSVTYYSHRHFDKPFTFKLGQ